MAKYLISFPSRAMDVAAEDMPQVAAESRAVIAEAKQAGVYVFGGGIDEGVAPVLVPPEGTITKGTYPGSHLDGGFCVLEVPSRAEAEQWAARIARSCRCSQELREFMYDPAS
jgi:hypothetical protein